jgi:hypothetical protein
MAKLVFGIVGLVIGMVIGIVVVAPIATGVGAGMGVATGISAGICSTVVAAQEEGIMTAEQVDQVLVRAARDMAGRAELPEGDRIVGSAAECDAVMARLRDAAG